MIRGRWRIFPLVGVFALREEIGRIAAGLIDGVGESRGSNTDGGLLLAEDRLVVYQCIAEKARCVAILRAGDLHRADNELPLLVYRPRATRSGFCISGRAISSGGIRQGGRVEIATVTFAWGTGTHCAGRDVTNSEVDGEVAAVAFRPTAQLLSTVEVTQ